jgi:hypothetical protein
MTTAAPYAYAVECRCGGVARGVRTAAAQVVRCPACGGELFVFPVPPLPADLAGGPSPPVARAAPRLLTPQARFWLPPALAGLATLVAVAAVIVAVVRGHRADPDTDDQPPTAAGASARLDRHVEAARIALADGSYRMAARELDAARRLHRRFPGVLSESSREQLRQWHRQATLLGDLLTESLSEIMAHAVGMDEREWRELFTERYAGKAFVLDARVWRDAGGRYQVDYRLEAAGLVGEWDVQGFALFGQLPLAQPQRLLFGARVADVARTDRARWRVRVAPDSGVLLTDPLLFAGLSVPLDDEGHAVLRRQAAWAAEVPAAAEGW